MVSKSLDFDRLFRRKIFFDLSKMSNIKQNRGGNDDDDSGSISEIPVKRGRGRPPGSKSKNSMSKSECVVSEVGGNGISSEHRGDMVARALEYRELQVAEGPVEFSVPEVSTWMKAKARDWVVTFWPDPEPFEDMVRYYSSSKASKGEPMQMLSPETYLSRFDEFFACKPLSFCCFQIERCPDTGRIHGQMYLEFSSVRMMSYVVALLKSTISVKHPYVAIRKGTQQQAIDYSTKGETALQFFKPFMAGLKKHHGGRSDLSNMVDMVMTGATKMEIIREFGGNALRHLGMIDRAQKAFYGMDAADNAVLEARRRAELEEREFQIGVDIVKYTATNPVLQDYHASVARRIVAEITEDVSLERQAVIDTAKYGKSGDEDEPRLLMLQEEKLLPEVELSESGSEQGEE